MSKAMIVTAQPEASEAGARVLMRGGNAVDAAMAAALVQGVVDPQMCGITGFGSGPDLHAQKMASTSASTSTARHPLAATPSYVARATCSRARRSDGFGFILREAT